MRRYIGFLVYCGVMLCALPLAAAPGPGGGQDESPVQVRQMGTLFTGVSDEALMVLAGTALIGVAAAVRRAA